MTTIDDVRHLEAELEEKRRVIAAFLKAERTKRGLSLRQAGRKVRIAHSGLLLIERGQSWSTPTVARILRYYERTDGIDGKTPTRAASRA
jgi:transcriptional regulator with XRE-family HTH domain